MTVANAFAESRNIPALKLAARVGIRKVIEMAHRFGVTSNIPPILPVALGAVEITLQEQVASYAVFPNDGIRVTPRLIRKVSNADGITLWQDNSAVNEVIDQQTARTMMTLLREYQHGRVPRPGSSSIRSAAKQEPPATSPMHGSWDFRRRSLVGSGWAMTAANRSAKRKPARSRHCPSG